MFADDTAIITQNKRFSVVISNLQHYVSLLELWLTDWKIKVNASKSACLMFTRRNQLPTGLTPVTIFGQPVPWTQSKETGNIAVSSSNSTNENTTSSKESGSKAQKEVSKEKDS
ncbi:hypothetical protein TNCV_3555261 [Trichonephila clavipes]|nr:hypothetical protein TNCV_3555261 [Trichonephila clavipes]